MNYITVNHDGIDERLEIIEETENDVVLKFENSGEILIITKEDLKRFN